MASTAFQTWLKTMPIKWLFGGPIGQKDATAQGQLYDTQADRLAAATQARFILQAPSDALPYIARDSVLLRGINETEDQFRVRLLTRWDDWARAGTPLELLVQLYWAGYDDAVIVQQNGLTYQLSGAPVEGQDPTSLLVIGHTMTLATPLTSPLTTNVIPDETYTSYSPSTLTPTPWWRFDDDINHCSRFAVILPTVPAPWTTYAVATFDGISTVETAVWSTPFTDTNYVFNTGTYVTDGSGSITVNAQNKQKLSIDVQVSAGFVGQVFLLGWEPGQNPFSNPHASDINTLKSIIGTWKNAKALCVGVYTILQGRLWGYPAHTWGDGITWGPSTSSFIAMGI